MDPTEIPQWTNGKRPRTDPVSKVLGDDDLLMEIILRVGFPTTLVRAALVCWHWLRRASDPAFLHRFLNLHPPRLLGFYVHAMSNQSNPNSPLFMPNLPVPPELGTVIHRAIFSLDAYQGKDIYITDCRNGNIFIHLYDSTTSTYTKIVHNPLCPDRGMYVSPRSPPHQVQDGNVCTWSDLVSKGEGDNVSYLYVWIESTRDSTKSTMHVSVLQDDVWCMHTSITSTHHPFLLWVPRPVVVDNKIYMASMNNIHVLDLSASSLSIVKLPHGVVKYGMRNAVMSRADDDSGVYLIHAKELQLGIWLHKKDKWLPVDTICLRKMLDNLRISHTENVHLNQVGNNAEFVLLQAGQSILYLDIKCRTLRKVYELERYDIMHSIHPFMMIWPPTFPALEDDPTSDGM